MQPGPVRTIRNGTKSCTECRRRKIRCIQSFENQETCRRCEERGLECIAQTHTSSRSTGRQRLSSQHQVASSSEPVHGMSQEPNHQATQNTELSICRTFEGSSDGDAPVLEWSVAQQPFHLRLLFQNDCLSFDGLSEGQDTQGCQTTNTEQMSVARSSLQRLIPLKDEISDLAGSACGWITMLHSFFPLPSGPTCAEEVLASYGAMHSPNVDTLKLTSWLLTVALMVEQLPPNSESTKGRLAQWERQKRRSKAISDVVQSRILVHDTLMSSIHGLSIFMQFIRLEMGRGNIHQAWLKLQHTIAIAELIGLRNTVRIAQLGTATGADISKARLWDLICAADRLLGMVLNLPPVTGHYREQPANSVSINGVVQTQVYLSRLASIANKVQDLDHLSTSNRPVEEIYVSSLELSTELNMLACQPPEAWWSGGVHGAGNVHPDHIVQFLHYYIVMRVHLPLALRRGPGGESLFNFLACFDACESMVERYAFLAQGLPRRLFLSEMLDLQVFSAAATLLLISYMSSVRSLDMGVDKIKINRGVGQVMAHLHERFNNFSLSDNAHHSFATLYSLNDLLRGSEDGHNLGQIAFHAPLVGQVQVRVNDLSSQSDSYWPSQLLFALGLGSADGQVSHPNLDASMQIEPENAQWARTAGFTDATLNWSPY